MNRRAIARNAAIQTLTHRARLPGPIVICAAISHHPALFRFLRTPAEMPEMTTKTPAKNVLWIMCDQLRYDYLGCTGHPILKTPNIDAMAKRGVLFSNAYVQSPICGPSRMSFYTGRYMRSHGSHWNGWPRRGGEPTPGDTLKKNGVRNGTVGKTHMEPELEGRKAPGIAPDSIIAVHVAESGFEPYAR